MGGETRLSRSSSQAQRALVDKYGSQNLGGQLQETLAFDASYPADTGLFFELAERSHQLPG